jgi:rRNA maturation protein Nop10
MARYKCPSCGGEFDQFDVDYCQYSMTAPMTIGVKKCPWCGRSAGEIKPVPYVTISISSMG